MDRGDLVPDEVIIGMILDCMEGPAAPTASCSTASRATSSRPRRSRTPWRTRAARVTATILIDVPDEEVVKRISGRRVCQKNGHVYNVFSDPPKHEDVCDQDGSRLVQREDDARDVVRKRLAVYHEQTAPLIAVLRGARRAQALRRPALAHRGPRPHPGDDRHAAPRRRAVIIKKSPEEIDKMAAAGSILVRTLQLLEGKVREGVTHEGPRRGGREVHPLAGRRAGVQGLPRLPGLDLRVAQLDGRARHPGPLQAPARRHHQHRRRRHQGRLGRRRRAHVPGRPGHADRLQAARRHRGSRCSTRSSSAAPATGSATSRTRSRQHVEAAG